MAETVKIKIETQGGGDIVKDLDKGVEAAKSLKLQLREANLELQRLSDQEGIDEQQLISAAQRVGELKDKISEANENAAAFSGNKFENVTSSLGGVKDAILGLDFSKASQMASNFATNAKQISFGGAVSSLKDLGKTFMTLGRALLTNPLFLIGAAIALLVVAIVKVLDKLGVLKQITEAVGKVFEFLMDAIEGVVTTITDFIGVTSEAQREASASIDETIASVERARNKSKDISNNYISSLENELKIAKANGEDTKQIEMEIMFAKRDAVADRMFEDRKELDAKRDKLRTSKNLSDEEKATLKKEIKDLSDGLKEKRGQYKSYNADITASKAQAITDDTNAQKKADEDEAAKRKAANDKRREDQKAYDKLRLDTRRQIEDLNLELVVDSEEKELEANRLKYTRLIEDTKSNEKLTKDEKLKINDAYGKEKEQQDEIIKNNYIVKKKAETDAAIAEQNRLLQEMISIEDEIAEKSATARDLKIDYMTEGVDKEIAIRQAQYSDELIQLQKFLDDETLTREEYDKLTVEAEKKKAADIKVITDKAAEDEKVKAQTLANLKIQAVMDTITTISNLSQLFAGQNEKAQKRAFNIQKGAQIAQATIDTYKSATGAYSSLSSVPVIGPVLGAAAAAAALTAGFLNIKKIASTEFKADGGTPPPPGGGTPPPPPNISSSNLTPPTPPSLTLNGSAMEGGEGSGLQLFGARQGGSDTRSYVVESDITGTQKRLRTYQQRAEIG
jgi:hypothetical protein